MASRFTVTTRLANVIEMVTLSKQSGILRATRGQGAQREMGQIRFIAGEPVSALLGSLTGGAALTSLSTWGECAYVFDEIAADASVPGAPAPFPTSDNSLPSESMPSGSWPSYGYPSSNNLGGFPTRPEFGSSGDMSVSPRWDAGMHSGTLGSYPYGDAGDAYGAAANTGHAGHAGQSAAAPTVPLTPEQLQARPRRTALSEQIDQLPLDRRERMALLLVDGQRTVADLVRLTRRSDMEVFGLLNHLRMLGLVQL